MTALLDLVVPDDWPTCPECQNRYDPAHGCCFIEKHNDRYNRRIDDLADFEEDNSHDLSPGRHRKRIPYMGWVWRDVDFYRKEIPIGRCGSYIGVMESNKWGYPERWMTTEEANTFIGYLDRAFAEIDAGRDAETIFDEMFAWFQKLEIKDEG